MSYLAKEIIGIVASVLILISMCFKTLSFKGSLWMRIINIIGSIVFVVYGALIPAISTAVLNGILILINTWHVITLIKKYKNTRKKMDKRQDLKVEREGL